MYIFIYKWIVVSQVADLLLQLTAFRFVLLYFFFHFFYFFVLLCNCTFEKQDVVVANLWEFFLEYADIPLAEWWRLLPVFFENELYVIIFFFRYFFWVLVNIIEHNWVSPCFYVINVIPIFVYHFQLLQSNAVKLRSDLARNRNFWYFEWHVTLLKNRERILFLIVVPIFII